MSDIENTSSLSSDNEGETVCVTAPSLPVCGKASSKCTSPGAKGKSERAKVFTVPLRRSTSYCW